MNKISAWVEYDSYGDMISGKEIISDNKTDLIEKLSGFENKPECFSAYPGLQISIMVTEKAVGTIKIPKTFYAIEEAIRYVEGIAA